MRVTYSSPVLAYNSSNCEYLLESGTDYFFANASEGIFAGIVNYDSSVPQHVLVTVSRTTSSEVNEFNNRCWDCLNPNDENDFYFCPSDDKCYSGNVTECASDLIT